MTVSKRMALMWWLGGLAIFACSLWLHAPLAIEAVPNGILDHQAAPDAVTVNAIQAAWAKAGLSGQARIAMISDLIFIGIYGLGCVFAGLYYKRAGTAVLRILGWVALVSGAVFLATDYGETIAQFIQLTNGQGSDALAGFASALGPPKVWCFIGGFLSVAIALIVEWTVRRKNGKRSNQDG